MPTYTVNGRIFGTDYHTVLMEKVPGCILGEVGHRDYYGNYVPSRYEVKAGTKGSVEYANAKQEAAQ